MTSAPQLPRVPEGSARVDPQIHRRERRLPAHLLATFEEQVGGFEIATRAAYAAVFARTLADWAKDPDFRVHAVGDGPVDIDAHPSRSMIQLARDIQRQLDPDRLGPIAFTVDTWFTHEVVYVDEGTVLAWSTYDGLLPYGLVDDFIDTHVRLLRHLAWQAGAWHKPAPELLPAHQLKVRKAVNSTGAPLDAALLHELFWAQALLRPRATAVVAEDRTLTYREVRVAAAKLGKEISPHRMVGVVMHKGWKQVVAVLGILAGGGAYVPIAPDVPPERLAHLIGHAGITLIVTDEPLDVPVTQVRVDESYLSGDASAEDEEIAWAQRSTDLAYVIYTSGSTGQPKGVMIDHRGAVNTILDINRRWRVGPDDRVFALSSLGFDLSVYDIFGILAAGGAVVMPHHGTERAPWEWVDIMVEHGVTVWNTVPALMEMLVEYTAGRHLRLAPSLRLVLMSGDWIPVSLPDRIRALSNEDVVVIGMGGATEASIWSNYYTIGAVDPSWPSIPYGTPLANQSFEVLDAAMRRRPEWVPGELYIGGMGVAMGYLNDPERTAASFVRHPETGARLYRTGDLGRYLPDGILEFLGREDFQVKVHGFRVELGEIEAALLAHDKVSGAVVVATGAAPGSKRLVAYVTPADAPADDLRGYLAAKLPPYLLPDRFVAMAQFPLTANGKVDRQAMP